jgi:hypothetical protein
MLHHIRFAARGFTMESPQLLQVHRRRDEHWANGLALGQRQRPPKVFEYLAGRPRGPVDIMGI